MTFHSLLADTHQLKLLAASKGIAPQWEYLETAKAAD
jgi:hypothetical protein